MRWRLSGMPMREGLGGAFREPALWMRMHPRSPGREQASRRSIGHRLGTRRPGTARARGVDRAPCVHVA